MRITCPSCHTEYDVSDEKLAGRMVRCARCATEWTPVPEFAAPPVEEEAQGHALMPEPPVMDEPEPVPFPPQIVVPPRQAPAPPPPQQSAVLAWIASLVVIVAAVTASYIWRADVMQVWPPSQRAYQALGLH